MFISRYLRFQTSHLCMYAHIDVRRKETLDSNVRKLNNIDLRRARVQMEHVLYKPNGHAIPV